MTRKGYELIAEAIRRTDEHDPSDEWCAGGWHGALSALAQRVARSLAEDNPRFDRRRFLDACGMPGAT